MYKDKTGKVNFTIFKTQVDLNSKLIVIRVTQNIVVLTKSSFNISTNLRRK